MNYPTTERNLGGWQEKKKIGSRKKFVHLELCFVYQNHLKISEPYKYISTMIMRINYKYVPEDRAVVAEWVSMSINC